MLPREHNATYVIIVLNLHCAANTSQIGVLVPQQSPHSLTISLKILADATPLLCVLRRLWSRAGPIRITCAAHSGTAVLTSGWQQSDLVRTTRHHAAEPSSMVANVVLARCMARQSTSALVGGVICAES